ncbi:hypothetical protein ACKFKG_29670 [Phormidesmis sp. 146-35]
MKFLAVAITPGSPLNPLRVRDFEQEILSESPPDLGGWGAEALNNEAKKLYRIHVNLVGDRANEFAANRTKPAVAG